MLHLAALVALPLFQAESAQAARPWTLLVYGAADNNADGPILHFLDGVRQALDDDPGMELVLLLDRSFKHSEDELVVGEDFVGARLYRLRKDSAERLDGGQHFPGIGVDRHERIDSADPENLRRFIEFGKARFPARRTGLLIYSHANGETMCPDEDTRRAMGIAEVSDRLGVQHSVDFLALELCNMAGIEVAYQWRPGPDRFGADVLVAIPNAGPPLDWDRAFARIRSKGHASDAQQPHFDPATMTAAQFGELVIEEGLRGRQRHRRKYPEEEGLDFEAAACLDLRAVAEVKRAVDALAVELARTEGKAAFLALRGDGGKERAIQYERGGPFVDLYDLCRRAADCPELAAEPRASARAVLEPLDRCVLASFALGGHEGFESGKNGVYIVLPSTEAGRWKRFQWYTPLPLAGGKGPYGRWAFLADGAQPGNGAIENWFELLDAWYDTADEAGGGNGYRH